MYCTWYPGTVPGTGTILIGCRNNAYGNYQVVELTTILVKKTTWYDHSSDHYGVVHYFVFGRK